jgi:hypothetical protein
MSALRRWAACPLTAGQVSTGGTPRRSVRPEVDRPRPHRLPAREHRRATRHTRAGELSIESRSDVKAIQRPSGDFRPGPDVRTSRTSTAHAEHECLSVSAFARIVFAPGEFFQQHCKLHRLHFEASKLSGQPARHSASVGQTSEPREGCLAVAASELSD